MKREEHQITLGHLRITEDRITTFLNVLISEIYLSMTTVTENSKTTLNLNLRESDNIAVKYFVNKAC